MSSICDLMNKPANPKTMDWMTRKYVLLFFFVACVSVPVSAQELMDLLEEEDTLEYVTNTFKSTRIINAQSVENPYPDNLIFVISHHFGRINQGAYHLWGLDNATIRLGFEYGVNDRLAIAVGRSSYEKTFDGFVKFKLLRQQTGLGGMPMTVSWFSGVYLMSLRWGQDETERVFSDRLSYVHQLLIARRFTPALSLQITPALVRKNLVHDPGDPDSMFALGLGGRIGITNRITLNAEYYFRFSKPVSPGFYNPLSVGFDFDTGGHVFQLHFTNTQPMFERGIISETRGSWLDGDIYFGFNITRAFQLR